MGKLDNQRRRPTGQPTAAPQPTGGKLDQQRFGSGRRNQETPTEQVNEARSRETALRDDFTALSEDRAGDVKNWREVARMAVQLGSQEDDQSRALKDELLRKHGDQLRPHLDIIDTKWWDENFTPEPEKGWKDKALGGASTLLGNKYVAGVTDYLDQWGQQSLSALAGVEAAVAQGDGVSAKEGLSHAAKHLGSAFDPTRVMPGKSLSEMWLKDVDDPRVIVKDDGTRLSFDRDEDGQINLREALGKDPEKGGRWLGAVDLVGTIAMDPTTYVSFGGSSMTKTGLRTIVDQAAARGSKEFGEELVQRIARTGFRSLSGVDQKLVADLLQDGVRDATRKTTRVTGRALDVEQLAAIRRGGQSGAKFGGKTVLPTGRAGNVARKAGVLDNTIYRQTDELAGGLPKVVKESATPGLARKAAALPGVRGVFGRSRLAASQGAEAANKLGELLSINRSANVAAQDIVTRLGVDDSAKGLYRAAQEESGDVLDDILNVALSDPAEMDRAILQAGEGSATAQLLQTVGDVRQEVWDAAVKGGADPTKLRDLDTYIPRVLSAEAAENREFLDEIAELGLREGVIKTGARVSDPALNQRTLATEIDDLFEANAEFADKLRESGLGDAVEEMFETNPAAAFAVRAQTAMKAQAEVKLLDEITNMPSVGGGRLGYRIRQGGEIKDLDGPKIGMDELAKDGVRRADYRTVDLPNGDKFLIHKDVAQEMKDVRVLFDDPRNLGAVANAFNKANDLWASLATVPLVSTAFFARNAMGNVFNLFLGGMRDFSQLGGASKLQQANRRITAAMRESGLDYAQAAARAGIDPDDVKLLSDARRLGVLGDGRSLDLLKTEAGGPTIDNAIVKPGRALGTSIENNARLAGYLDQVAKGASPQAAAAHVKKYLFDYGDLTRFESEGLRNVSRFYTFTRKNFGLQAMMLAQYPSRVVNAQAVSQGFVDFITDPTGTGEASFMPDWAVAAGLRQRSVGDRNVAVGIDTPLAGFVETSQQLAQVPGINELLRAAGAPESVAYRDSQERWRGAMGLFSGVGDSLSDLAYEGLTGRDSFTNRTLDPEANVRDTGWFRFFDTFMPLVGKSERETRKWLEVKDQDGDAAKLRALNAFLGLTAYELDEDTDSSTISGVKAELMDAMDDLRDSGIDFPTIDELREEGELYRKNEMLEALSYSFKQDEEGEWQWDDPNSRLLSVVPADLRAALGLPDPDTTGRAPQTDLDLSWDADQVRKAVEELMGRTLTDEEAAMAIASLPGAPGNRDLELAGYEPYRENVFEREEKEEVSDEDRIAATNDRLRVLAEAWGVDPEAFGRIRPRLSDSDRIMRDAEAAGVPRREALDYFLAEKISRTDQARINEIYEAGIFTVEKYRDGSFTEEDAQKAQERAWESEAELRVLAQLEGLPAPTAEQVQLYALWTEMTKSDQERVGIPTQPSVPNRKDIRTDEQKAEDARTEAGAVLKGLDRQR